MKDKDYIKKNFEQVRGAIRRACERSGRSQDSVTLIAVSKYKPVTMIHDAMECQQTVFGENRVQELCEKMGSDRRGRKVAYDRSSSKE